MNSQDALKSRIGAALNDLDRGWLRAPERWTFSATRAGHEATIERFRQAAAAAEITDYLMRVVLGRTVRWGCTEFDEPYEVMKPLADRWQQYPPWSMDDAINARMTWFRYVLGKGQLAEAREQIDALESLLPTLTKGRQPFVSEELFKLRASVESQE